MTDNAVTVATHTLGCKVNRCDTEALLVKLTEAGFLIREFGQVADIYIINTCTVTHTGDKKSLQMIRRARRLNPSAFVAVCGCMPCGQADSTDKIKNSGADFIFDTRTPDQLLSKLSEIFSFKAAHNADSLNERTRAFIKIQDGCNRYCAYCIVPYVRGPVVSRPLDDILIEATENIRRGVQEIVLTGIQVAAYGYDTGSEIFSLPELIKQLAGLDPKRLRLSSVDPWAINDAFLAVVADSPTLCSHFHLSLQSGSDRTLVLMNRRYTAADYAKAADELRDLRPNMALTTDIIVGFPGERDEDFQESMQFVENLGFARIHVFEYSPRAGTVAADFPDQVPTQVKSARGEKMRALAKKLELQFLSKQVNTVSPVLFEAKTRKAPVKTHKSADTWQGHTDNYCLVRVAGINLANSLKNVQITGIADDGLTGYII